jgi:hypothetical protein
MVVFILMQFVVVLKNLKKNRMKTMRKILHLENKTTNEHRYYGSLVALCMANESIIPQAFYHTLKRIKFETPYETETYIIRLGSLQVRSDLISKK